MDVETTLREDVASDPWGFESHPLRQNALLLLKGSTPGSKMNNE